MINIIWTCVMLIRNWIKISVLSILLYAGLDYDIFIGINGFNEILLGDILCYF